MAYQVGDTVFVPSSKLADARSYPFALHRTTVRVVEDRSVKVMQSGGENSEWIASSKCHANVGILILSVGDGETEYTLLDPLAKSLLHYCKLLLEDSYVLALKVRSVGELSKLWGKIHAAYSHIILVGHGNGADLNFAADGWVPAASLSEALRPPGVGTKLIVSLTCKAGLKAFGGSLSRSAVCREFIGPFDAVHGAIASQFAQTFLAFQLLAGESSMVAFRHARARVPLSTSFRLWRNGDLTAGPAA